MTDGVDKFQDKDNKANIIFSKHLLTVIREIISIQ